jgi:hypothetical protein
MTPTNKNITDSSYTYEKSDIVPDWVSKLDDLKSKIKAHLHSPDSGKDIDVQFCHPVNVPASKK